MKTTKLEEILTEIMQTAECYERTTNKEIKEHYNNYINLLIENDVDNQYKEKVREYWNSLIKINIFDTIKTSIKQVGEKE